LGGEIVGHGESPSSNFDAFHRDGSVTDDEGLKVAKETLKKFVTGATQLYEQEPRGVFYLRPARSVYPSVCAAIT